MYVLPLLDENLFLGDLTCLDSCFNNVLKHQKQSLSTFSPYKVGFTPNKLQAVLEAFCFQNIFSFTFQIFINPKQIVLEYLSFVDQVIFEYLLFQHHSQKKQCYSSHSDFNLFIAIQKLVLYSNIHNGPKCGRRLCCFPEQPV